MTLKSTNIIWGWVRNRILSFAGVMGFCLMLLPNKASAQWTDHVSYYNCTKAAAVGQIPMAACECGIVYYDPVDGTMGKLSKTNHLTSSHVTAIEDLGNQLAIGYEDGNIDFLDPTNLTVVNIPELNLSSIYDNKSINTLTHSGSALYCAFEGGVLEINIPRQEIRSSWRISSTKVNVTDVAVSDNTIWASTDDGIYHADLNSLTLEDPAQWSLTPISEFTSNSDHIILGIETMADGAVAAVGTSGGAASLWCLTLSNGSVQSTKIRDVSNFRSIKSFTSGNKGLVLTTTGSIEVLNTDFSVTCTIGSFTSLGGTQLTSSPALRQAVMMDNGQLSVADGSVGLLVVNTQGVGNQYCPQGPNVNNLTDIEGVGNAMYFTGEGRDKYKRLYKKPAFNVYRDNSWKTVWGPSNCWDPVYVVANKQQPTEIYISTFATGVFKIENDEWGTNYTRGNSSIGDIFDGALGDFVRTDVMCFDKSNNFFVASPVQEKGMHIMTPEGEWYSLGYATFNNNNRYTDWHADLIATSANNLWMVGEYGYLTIFNINGTPETQDDDQYYCMDPYYSEVQCRGKIELIDYGSDEVVGTNATAVVEDRDGLIWLGTDAGLLTCANDKKIFTDGGPVFNRVKVPRNDGTNLADYLLDGVEITQIVVDGANRKWIGTMSDGVYLVSADGYETLHHFTTSNSPLLSNEIKKIGIRPSDGEVFILSTYGLQSYSSDASEPVTKLDDNIVVYPNPISIDHGPGYVTINGLEFDSRVFITDVAGNRVFKGTSNGGTARWDLYINGGGRVTPGVYIVWASSSDGKNKAVGKILVTD